MRLAVRSVIKFIFSLCLLLSIPAFAGWGNDIMSIDAAKHWIMDNRMIHVRGTVSEVIGSEGFKLSDDTGEIYVSFMNSALKNFCFHSDMRVEVRGKLEHEHNQWNLEATAIRLHDDSVIGH